jgi:hypothetical protein
MSASDGSTRRTGRGQRRRWRRRIRLRSRGRRRKRPSSDSDSQCTRSQRRRELTGREASNSPAPSAEKPVVPPVSGLRKGETPQQYVARTVALDLGDF